MNDEALRVRSIAGAAVFENSAVTTKIGGN
jgi:hypothetical protein